MCKGVQGAYISASQDAVDADIYPAVLPQVQTNGECEPKAAMQDALQDLQNEFGEIAASFAVSCGLDFAPPVLS